MVIQMTKKKGVFIVLNICLILVVPLIVALVIPLLVCTALFTSLWNVLLPLVDLGLPSITLIQGIFPVGLAFVVIFIIKLLAKLINVNESTVHAPNFAKASSSISSFKRNKIKGNPIKASMRKLYLRKLR